MSIEKTIGAGGFAGEAERLNELGTPSDMEINVVLENDGEEGLDSEVTAVELRPYVHNENLVLKLLESDEGKSKLETLGKELIADFNNDDNSRKEWKDTLDKGMDLLGLKIAERTEPWDGACGVFHPMLAEAAVRFQSEMIMETFPPSGPVKTKILGKVTKDKEAAAGRVKEDMNHELVDKMTEYRPEHERLLWNLSLMGSAFKKIYFDPNLDRQTAVFTPAEDLVVPYGATDLQNAPRVTHVMRKTKNEIMKLQLSGFYRDDIVPPDPTTPATDNQLQTKKDKLAGTKPSIIDSRLVLLEMQVELTDIEPEDETTEVEGEINDRGQEGVDIDDIALPYVVTIERSTGTIYSIYRNWNEDDAKKRKRDHFVHYIYIPGFGFYGFGLIHLIGGHAQSATALTRQLVDAGTLSNLPGGLKASGFRVKGEDVPIAPGEWRDVDLPGGKIQDNIFPMPYKEPSQVLNVLLDKIVADAKEMAATANLKIGDLNKETPVGTTLAILERTLKVMSAVAARVHAAMKEEFKLLKNIIKDLTSEQYEYEVDGEMGSGVKKSDYDAVEVIPVSDPNATTLAQRVVMYQTVLNLAQQKPELYNMPLLHQRMVAMMGIPDAEKLVPTDEDKTPMDPVSENMAIMTSKPIKAFLAQDHDAHLAVHVPMIQNPKFQAQLQQMGPLGQSVIAAANAHVMEHVAMQYRRNIEKIIGAPLPAPDEKLPQEVETSLSKLMAEAAGRLLGKDQMEMQQQQIQQQMQDPILQMQREEIGIKREEVERKKQKDVVDAELKEKELMLKAGDKQGEVQREFQKAQIEKQKGQDKIMMEREKHAMKMQQEKEKMVQQQHAQGFKMGVDMINQQRKAQQPKGK